MAKLIIPTPLRKFTNNASSIETDGSTVKDAISDLINQYPDLQKHLLDEAGSLRSFVRVFVGDDDIQALQGEATDIQENTVVSIIPAIAGGSY